MADANPTTGPTLLGRLARRPTDQAAWGEFVTRYGPLIDGWCRRWGLHCVAFSPDSRLLATGGADGTARVWDAATARPVGPALAHRSDVYALAFRGDSRALATGSTDGVVQLWALPEPVVGDLGDVRRWVRTATGLDPDDAAATPGESGATAPADPAR